MSHFRVRFAAVLAAVLLPLGLLTLTAAAGPASAATAASGSLIGACSPLQAGEFRVVGRYPNSYIIQCEWVPGLGGYYWVRYSNSCGAAPADGAAGRC